MSAPCPRSAGRHAASAAAATPHDYRALTRHCRMMRRAARAAALKGRAASQQPPRQLFMRAREGAPLLQT
jgi:hypothetical protein